MGLPAMVSDKHSQPFRDSIGYSLWHYWSESPRPCDLWSSVLRRLSHNNRDHKSDGGEHVWHRLALRGHMRAMQLWEKAFDNPCMRHGIDHVAHGKDDDTMLIRAAWSGNDDLVSWAMSQTHGSDLNKPDIHGHTPLIIAVHRCGLAAVQNLLHHGADPEECDYKGRSAMHHAAQCENADVYTMIQDCGGEPSRKDANGVSAEHLLTKTTRTKHQAQMTQYHWEKRYQVKLEF